MITSLDRPTELKQIAATYEREAKLSYQKLLAALESPDPSDLETLIEHFREHMAIMIKTIDAYKSYISELEKFLPI